MCRMRRRLRDVGLGVRRGSSERCRCGSGSALGSPDRTQDDTLRNLPVVAECQRATSSPRVRALIMSCGWFRVRRLSAFGIAAPARIACGTSVSAKPAGSCREARGRCSAPVPCRDKSDHSFPAGRRSGKPNLHQHPEGPGRKWDSTKARKI